MTRRSRRGRRVPRRADIWPRAWRRRPITVLILAIALAITLWSRSRFPPRAAGGSDYDRYHNRVFTCVHVVDGDTIDIGVPDGTDPKTRIRLWGVDTPETAKSPGGAGYYGAEASQFTRDRVLGREVRVVLVESRTRGKYGRLLAYVYPAGSETMLNEELIVTGHAYADHRFDHPWKQRFLALEARARKQQQGLWRHVTPEQMPEWRRRYEDWRASKAG
jgi:endonuclease YncB( thermonuclease family)